MIGDVADIRPILKQKEVIWVIGLILGGIGYGALLALGIACLVTFIRSPQVDERWSTSKKILATHVTLVLLCSTFLQVWNAESNINAIFYTDPDHITYFYHGWENIFIVFLAMLTEGILVWRCCMIQKVLCTGHHTNRWHHICWIFPAFLWLAGMTILAVVRLNPSASLFDEAESHSPGLTFFLIALAINFTLNTFATSNIIIRLFLYRRSVIAVLGHKNALAKYSLNISSILLESAAINLPLTLLSIIGLVIQADYAALLTQLITPGQCIASILVIYQVIRGRTALEYSPSVTKPGKPEQQEP